MRALLPVAVIGGVLGFAAPAAACGGCFDVALQHWWWGAPALAILAALLVCEVVMSAFVWRVVGHTPRVRRALITVFALVLGVAAAMFSGSVMAGALAMLIVLVPGFAHSLARELPGASRTAILRPLGVVVALVASSAWLLPSQRDTSFLISAAASGHSTDSWMQDELRKRPEADAHLDALLGNDGRKHKTLRLLRLHAQLTPPAHHAVVCARLIAQTPEEHRGPLDAVCTAP